MPSPPDPDWKGRVTPLKFKLTLAYDGAAYHGWQSRPDGSGVQDRVQTALARLFASAPEAVSSSMIGAKSAARRWALA